MSLFDSEFAESSKAAEPLAARVRPTDLTGYMGQSHLLGPGKPLREAIEQSRLHSMILWGPPGVGKTTLARMLAEICDVRFHALSAVLSGVRDIRDAIDLARQMLPIRTLLFVDEVHRFNKAQQDAFLPYVEDGTVIFVGATTENPSFEVNNALLSRTRVYKLRSLTETELIQLIERALATDGVLANTISIDQDTKTALALAADGDARRALSLLEICADLAVDGQVRAATLEEVLGSDHRRFDKGGDIFYDQISALHKAVRGSSPDAAIYWFVRMIDGGCDPLYIARRVVRMASEDIGNADPRCLQLALQAWDVQTRLGSPEGELAIAQAILFLATAAKSNAVYRAFNEARSDVSQFPDYEVPLHIRNAPTQLMKTMGHGEDYRYAHDYDDGFVAGESYLPPELQDRQYYQPVPRGLEIQVSEKLASVRQANADSEWKR
ncbi:MAG: replication-associated recombination protein A, partial [Pseudomonadota bacterium]